MTPGGGVGGSVDGVDNDGLLFTTVGGVEYNFYSNSNGTFSLLTNNGAGFVDSAPTLLNTDAPCFCAGTMVATDTGEAAVEDLSVGDTVLTVSGEHRPIRWIGRRIVATRFADPIGSMPIRIKAGALADNVPVRDMLLSPLPCRARRWRADPGRRHWSMACPSCARRKCPRSSHIITLNLPITN